MGRGFPIQNPPSGPPGINNPGQGSLLEYLRKNFPETYAAYMAIPKDTLIDAKDGKFTKKQPLRSGRVP